MTVKAAGKRAPTSPTRGYRPLIIRWAVLLAAASWLGYFICSGMPQVAPEVFPRALVLQSLTLVLALLYAAYLVWRRRLPGGSPLDWPIAGVLAAFALATIASVDWRVSLESTLLIVLAVLAFYALSDIHFLDSMSLSRALMLAGAAAAVWALLNVAGDYADWIEYARTARGSFQLGDLIPPTVPKVEGVSDHPNILGMVLTLIVPFYIIGAYRARAYWERAAWSAALLASAWAVFLTLSRGAWIGVIAGATVTAVGIVVLSGKWPKEALSRAAFLQKLRDRKSFLTWGLGLLAVLVVIVAALLVGTRWEARPQWLFRESLSPRQDVLEAGWGMFQDNVLLGAGPGAFPLLYPQYSGRHPVHGVHTHNGYLQLAVDTGILGLATVAALAIFTGWIVWSSYRRGGTSQRLTALACTGALVGFGVHNVADAANMWKAPLIALAAVLAIAVKNYADTRKEESGASPSADPERRISLIRLRPNASLLARGFIAVSLVALFVSWWRIDSAHYHYSESLHRSSEGDHLGAAREAQQAVDIDPSLAVYQLQLGLDEGLAYLDDGPEALLQKSIRHLENAVDRDPRASIGFANLARAYALAGRDDEAQAAALEAKRFAGADATVLVVAGNVLEDVGAEQDAVETYGAAITEMSSLADSRFWLGSEFRREHYRDILGRSVLAMNACAQGSLLTRASDEASDLIGADREELEYNCALYVFAHPDELTARVDFATMLMARDEFEASFDHIDYAVTRQPDLAPARTAMGKWYAAQGDSDKARQEWILAGQLGNAEALVLLGDTYPPGQVPKEVVERLKAVEFQVAGGARAYTIAFVYYRMKFARESPPIVFLPDDWQQAVPGEYDLVVDALQRWRSPS